MFASIRTFQVERYMTLDLSDPRAHAVDALSQPRSFPLLYAFPPPTLVPTVVNELRGCAIQYSQYSLFLPSLV